ncbi:MAG: Cof-type HAD-IIB family hydrolase [Melioribacteraceae bacterium]|nr:Cof-type HAD-IIB family hydrolase [Melioribacteraceae bacterium]MCO6474093.1 Cof-type HAD-IIB family hydrolase [Melioribacteraceae bacterium]
MLTKEKLKNIELIVFDMDGTLLNSSGEIGTQTVNLVKELRNHGVKFTFATGRLHNAIVDQAKLLEIHEPLISLDGSLIKSVYSNEIYYESYIPQKYVLKAKKLADQYLLKIALCHADYIYFGEYDALIPQLLQKFGAKYKETDNMHALIDTTLEIVMMGDYKDSIKTVLKKMSFPHSIGLRTNYYKTKSAGKFYYLEIRKKGSSKGTGIDRLAKILKVKRKNVAAIGDWYNDVDLLKKAGIKIAMANSVAEIKRLADYITKRDNDEDGTAEFLEMVLKAKK